MNTSPDICCKFSCMYFDSYSSMELVILLCIRWVFSLSHFVTLKKVSVYICQRTGYSFLLFYTILGLLSLLFVLTCFISPVSLFLGNVISDLIGSSTLFTLYVFFSCSSNWNGVIIFVRISFSFILQIRSKAWTHLSLSCRVGE